jgi:hypothetical protein
MTKNLSESEEGNECVDQGNLNKLNIRKSSPRHIIVKFSKVNDKKRTLNVGREKQPITYKRKPSEDFSAEAL